jgi:hypothetical protein
MFNTPKPPSNIIIETNANINLIKTKFISLGNSCSFRNLKNAFLKQTLKLTKYRNLTMETQLFDWLLTDLNSIVMILETNNIEEIINMNNISMRSNHVWIKDCTFKSIHDIQKRHVFNTHQEYLNNIKINFIDKYIRRYYRFINILSTTDYLLFMHTSYADINIINKLIHILKIKYPLLNFKIVSYTKNKCVNSYTKIFKHYYVIDNDNDTLLQTLIKIYNEPW